MRTPSAEGGFSTGRDPMSAVANVLAVDPLIIDGASTEHSVVPWPYPVDSVARAAFRD